MFSYIVDGESHTDTSPEYLKKLGLDDDAIESLARDAAESNDAEYQSANKYRVRMLYETDWIAQRQMEQSSAGQQATLTDQEFTDVLTWRQELRDMFRDTASFRSYVSPSGIHWPEMPDVIKPKYPDYPPK